MPETLINPSPTVKANALGIGHNARLVTVLSLLLGPVLGGVGYSIGVAWRGGMAQERIQITQAAHTRDIGALRAQVAVMDAEFLTNQSKMDKLDAHINLVIYRLGRIEHRLSIRSRKAP